MQQKNNKIRPEGRKNIPLSANNYFGLTFFQNSNGYAFYFAAGREAKIAGLSPDSLYCVTVESRASHANDNDTDPNLNDRFINKTRETQCEFRTAEIPGPLSNITVCTTTLTTIKLQWDALVNHESLVTAIQVNVSPVSSEHRTLHFNLSPETTGFSFEGLTPKTYYNFTFDLVLEDNFLMEDLSAQRLSSHFQTCTNGVDPPGKPWLVAQTQTSLTIEWEPSLSYGLSYVQHYCVHYAEIKQLRRRSRAKTTLAKDVGNFVQISAECYFAKLRELEPGVTYKIVVEAVLGVKDYNYDDEEFESDDNDDGGSSVLSSMPSIRARDEEQERCFGDPLWATTAATPEPPVLMISEISNSQVHLCWDQPALLQSGSAFYLLKTNCDV